MAGGRSHPPAVERERIRAIVVMCAIVMLFWVAFHQNGSTLTYSVRDSTDRTLGGPFKTELDPAPFPAINSFFVTALTPMAEPARPGTLDPR